MGSIESGFYKALERNSKLSDVTNIKYRLSGTQGSTATTTKATAPTGGGSVITLIPVGASNPTFQNVNVTHGSAVTASIDTGTGFTSFAVFDTTFSATSQDVTVSQLGLTSVPSGAVKMATTNLGSAAASVTPVDDYGGTTNVITNESISSITYISDESSKTVDAIDGGTETTTNTQNQTFTKLNGLRMQVSDGTEYTVNTGPIATSFGGNTETTTWNDGQQLQITQYELQFITT